MRLFFLLAVCTVGHAGCRQAASPAKPPSGEVLAADVADADLPVISDAGSAAPADVAEVGVGPVADATGTASLGADAAPIDGEPRLPDHEDGAALGADDGDAASDPGPVLPVGACADGLDLPAVGSPCTKEYEERCSRVGEKSVPASKTNLLVDTCVRPNRVRCVKTTGQGLAWALDPCPKLAAGCGDSEYMSCRSDLGGAACCPHFIPEKGAKIALAEAWRCLTTEVGHLACTGADVFKCTTFQAAIQAMPPPYKQEVESGYAQCLPAEPACLYFFPSQICPFLDNKLCSGWKESGTKQGYCTPNYDNKGPACLMNCDDFKKYSKDYQPPPPK